MTALKALGDQVGLTFGTPSTASDQNAFAVTKAFADKYRLKTLSDFAAKCSGTATVLAGPPECPQRPFCQPGLKRHVRHRLRHVLHTPTPVARRPRPR